MATRSPSVMPSNRPKHDANAPFNDTYCVGRNPGRGAWRRKLFLVLTCPQAIDDRVGDPSRPFAVAREASDGSGRVNGAAALHGKVGADEGVARKQGCSDDIGA